MWLRRNKYNTGVVDMNPDNVTEVYEKTIQQKEGK